MYISGFTFIKNAIKLDYPVAEAICSVLPLVDEMVIAVGDSEDETLELVKSLGPKIRIIQTVWDKDLREGGVVLAVETNKALDAVNPKADWCVYIQADECIHEQFHTEIKDAMNQYLHNQAIEALLFNYTHFYGSYDFIGDSRHWYRKEVRIIKNLEGIRSYRDAQGFRRFGRKLWVAELKAAVYHYGWVRHPKFQMAKQLEANKLWHSDEYVEKKFDAAQDFDYSQIDSIKRFNATHPQCMQDRIAQMNWSFDRDPELKSFTIKQKLLYLFEKIFNYRIGEYKNYRIRLKN